MSKSTISTFKLFEVFPNEEAARLYLEGLLWLTGVRCPDCQSGERITVRKAGYYRCNACKLTFTVRTRTIFERSHVPLHKWTYVMYLMVTARKGLSSMQLSKEIGITQKSTRFLLHRLRVVCNDENIKRGAYGMKETVEELDKMAAAVLRYRPKPKTKAEKRRIRREKRDARKLGTLTPVSA